MIVHKIEFAPSKLVLKCLAKRLGVLLMEAVPQFILDAVRKAAKKCGFHEKDVEIRIEPCNSQDGFIGQLFRVVVKQGSMEKNMICKIPPLCAARREQFDASPMFEREPWFYGTILPQFEKYQREKGIKEGDGFVAFAASYVAYYESMDEGTVLVMEDLAPRGFRMYDKLLPLDYEHVKLLMVQLGRLHAISFAMKRDQSELYKSLEVPDAIIPMFRKNKYCQFLVSESLKMALEIPDFNDAERKILHRLKDNVVRELEMCLDAEKSEPYNAIIHCDCWINNFMYRYGKNNRHPSELVLIDWQLGCHAAPAIDLVYLFFLCTDAAFRKLHYDEMLQVYHRSLSDLLRMLGGIPEVDYPYRVLQKQLRQVGRYGVLMGSFLVPSMCIAREDLPNLDESAARQMASEEYELPFKLDENSLPVYQERMLGVIRDAVRYGYFDL